MYMTQNFSTHLGWRYIYLGQSVSFSTPQRDEASTLADMSVYRAVVRTTVHGQLTEPEH